MHHWTLSTSNCTAKAHTCCVTMLKNKQKGKIFYFGIYGLLVCMDNTQRNKQSPLEETRIPSIESIQPRNVSFLSHHVIHASPSLKRRVGNITRN